MMRSRILLVLFIALFVLNGRSSAQKIVGDANAVYHGFLDPPRDFSPMPLWFWNGRMEGPIIQSQIRDMVNPHVYGAFLHGRDGLRTRRPTTSPNRMDLSFALRSPSEKR
jgi:hypothetical protein